jgi:hypothetical protein
MSLCKSPRPIDLGDDAQMEKINKIPGMDIPSWAPAA